MGKTISFFEASNIVGNSKKKKKKKKKRERETFRKNLGDNEKRKFQESFYISLLYSPLYDNYNYDKIIFLMYTSNTYSMNLCVTLPFLNPQISKYT